MTHEVRDPVEGKEALQERFSYIFPSVPYASLPDVATPASYLSFFVDMWKEGYFLQEFKKTYESGHMFTHRFDFAIADHLHVDHHVVAVSPSMQTAYFLPTCVRSLIRANEETGRVGVEHIENRYPLMVLGLARERKPVAVIWYSQGEMATQSRQWETAPVRIAGA